MKKEPQNQSHFDEGRGSGRGARYAGPPPPLCLLFRQNMDGAWNGVRMDQRVFYSAYNQPYHQNIHLISIFAYRTNNHHFSGYKGVGYRINPATGPI